MQEGVIALLAKIEKSKIVFYIGQVSVIVSNHLNYSFVKSHCEKYYSYVKIFTLNIASDCSQCVGPQCEIQVLSLVYSLNISNLYTCNPSSQLGKTLTYILVLKCSFFTSHSIMTLIGRPQLNLKCDVDRQGYQFTRVKMRSNKQSIYRGVFFFNIGE